MPRLTWEKITLKLRNPFRLSYGVSETRDAFWLRVHPVGAGSPRPASKGGETPPLQVEGWGEGTIPPYYRVDPSEMISCWQQASDKPDPIPDSLEQIPAWIPEGPSPARSAVELALLDRL